MFCKNCGNNVEDTAFCSVCGAALKTEAPNTYDSSPAPAPAGPSKTLPLISMILGIVSLAGGITPAAIASIILAIISNKKAAAFGVPGDKKAKIGLICSIISLVMNVLAIVAIILLYVVIYGGFFAIALGASGGY